MNEPSYEYEYGGYKYKYNQKFVWAVPGELHPRYVLYSKINLPEDYTAELWEAKVVNGIESILRNREHWIAEADDREGLPPGLKAVAR